MPYIVHGGLLEPWIASRMCGVSSMMVVTATSLRREYLGRTGGSCGSALLLMVDAGALAEPVATDDTVYLTFHDVSGGIDIHDGLPHVAPLYGATGGVCTYWSYQCLGPVSLVHLAAADLVQVSLMVPWL